MRLLLDTHALIWWLAGDPALSRRSRDAIADTRLPLPAEAGEIAVRVVAARHASVAGRAKRHCGHILEP